MSNSRLDTFPDRSIGRRNEDFNVRKQIQKHHQLFKVGQTITSTMDFSKLFEVVMGQTNQIMECQRSTLFLYDEKRNDLFSLVATGLKKNEIRIPAVMLTAHALNYETLMHSIRSGSIAFLPKEKMAELDRPLEMLMDAHNAGESTWKVLFDEMGDFYNQRFGKPMGTVEWICRQIKSGKMQ